jgi:periplasmic protein TonB
VSSSPGAAGPLVARQARGERPGRRARALLAAGALSAALHAGGWAAAARLEPRPPRREQPVTLDLEIAPPARPAPPPPRPAPRRVVVAAATLPPAPAEAPLPPPSEPPPSAPPARAVPRVGLTLSSTAVGGAFAVGVGNTLHGRAAEVAADPASVRAYAAPVAAARLSAQPRLLDRPEVPYPAEARRAGVQGRVVLLLRVDAEGRVAAARVLDESGAGLGEAARAAALRFRFSPALLDGGAVETELRFTYTFVLE